VLLNNIILCFSQQSLLTVLKESFKVYKAISEGLINLADRFFEMEYLDAHKGLEVYKESIVANDRLQQYYQQIEQIEELRRAIQFPKLESPPADFLTQMEAYAKEAPRPYDESSGSVTGSKKVLLLLDESSALCTLHCALCTLLVVTNTSSSNLERSRHSQNTGRDSSRLCTVSR